MNDMYVSLDKHSRIKLLQLDLSYSIDSIYLDILINRLLLIGITGDVLKILILLIQDRTYSVKIYNCISGYFSIYFYKLKYIHTIIIGIDNIQIQIKLKSYI